MLEAAGIPFEIVDSGLDEDGVKAALAHLGAAELALQLAERKALAASAHDDALILGADQTLELHDGIMLSKPRSRAELEGQLRRMRGKVHRLHSAAVIVEGGKPSWRHLESVTLAMRPLSDGFIAAYLDAEYEQVRWNVGGYRIEGPGVQLFDSIEGSHFAILGLPLLPLLVYLRQRELLAS